MSKTPARACGRPGCMGIIREGVCSTCGAIKRTGWQDDTLRGTRHSRGYGRDWVRLRRAFIEQKTLEAALNGVSPYPVCELCGKPVVEEIHVDHITPHKGVGDPARLDERNLRITHMRCHMRHTASGKGSSPG